MTSIVALQATWKSPWIVALSGFAALYLPIYWWALNTIWQTEEHAHGLLIAMVLAWLFWESRHKIASVIPRPATAAGWGLFVLGLMLYVLGRIFNITTLQLGSQIPVLGGVLLVLLGWPGIRAAWFPLCYLIFIIPLPGPLVDAVTGPLKQWISVIAECLLYAAGYPVARSGVTLSVGQYQLLVADACSGIRSMFSLLALGALFLHIKARSSLVHNVLMMASILPIAFVANIVRVMVLVLVTYHFGDDAGQGFLHGAAGMLLMIVALLILFLLDATFSRAFKSRAVGL